MSSIYTPDFARDRTLRPVEIASTELDERAVLIAEQQVGSSLRPGAPLFAPGRIGLTEQQVQIPGGLDG
jgi:hypothetical protein